MKIDAGTDVGNVRENNQDYVDYKVLNDNEYFCVLCDGMGGHNAGEVASKLAGEDMVHSFSAHPEFSSDEDIKKYLNALLEHANLIIKNESDAHVEYRGMGTTAVVSYVIGDTIYTSHVGDSRAYILKDHCLYQITHDDTLVNDLVERGYITKEQAENHPRKNILSQAVGVTAPLDVSFHKYTGTFETLFLCSDGLYNSLKPEEIVEILDSDMDIHEKTDKLIKQSKILGGYDNISVLIVERGE